MNDYGTIYDAIKENTAEAAKQNHLLRRQEALLVAQTELLAALVLDFSQDNTTRVAAVSRAKATLEKLNYPTDTIDLLIGRCDL